MLDTQDTSDNVRNGEKNDDFVRPKEELRPY